MFAATELKHVGKAQVREKNSRDHGKRQTRGLSTLEAPAGSVFSVMQKGRKKKLWNFHG